MTESIAGKVIVISHSGQLLRPHGGFRHQPA
jgi:hypothetical protein